MAVNSDLHIHNMVICANVFVRKDGQWLMLRRSPQKRFAPNVVHPVGGKVDPDENPETAARRELLEEAGIEVDNLRLEAVILELTPVRDRPENWLIFHFSGDYARGEVLQTDEGEIVMLTDEEILASDLFPSVRQVIEHILSPHDGTVFATFSYAGDAIKTESMQVLKR